MADYDENALYPRGARTAIREALQDTRVVLVLGARQVGKSTLTELVASTDHPAFRISLDEDGPRAAAQSDPEGFVASLSRPVMIDEIQRGGEDLMLSIKLHVDQDMTPGQFLLTGSANLFHNRKVADTLAGRIEVVHLWPLTQAEIAGSTTSCVEWMFRASPPLISDAPVGRDAMKGVIAPGGYPEARQRSSSRRNRWFENYLSLTLERDLASITDAHKLDRIPKLLRMLGTQAANLLVPGNLSKRLDLSHHTVESYISLLEATYLIRRIPAWRPNLGQREIKAAKGYVVDSGLLLHLLNSDEDRLITDDSLAGMALENFVAMEVLRHAEWTTDRPSLHHYRRGRDEIDLILENRAGEIVAIEVKTSASIGPGDWRVLAKLRDQLGDKFKAGYLIHTTGRTTPLGDRLFSIPLSSLWP